MGDLADWELPRWLVVSTAVAGLLLLGYLGGKIFMGRSGDPAPPKRVYPGMYDIRAEAARMRATQQNGAAYGR